MKQTNAHPNAWIVKNNRRDNLSNDRGRLKIYPNNSVYLDDKEQFEIELHNPLKISVLANIKIQDSLISKSGLVVRPGERIYLDCYIDSKKKFQFNTYQVDNNSENKSAISNNGLVEIIFYKEEIIYTQDYPNFNWTTHTGTFHTNNSNLYGWTNGVLNTTNPTTNTFTTLGNTLNLTNISTSNSSLTKSLDTGRIEGSNISDAKFNNIDIKFESMSIGTIKYQILPISTKPFSSDDIKQKLYCSNCGKKIKNSDDNYCSSCGSKINK